MIQFLVWYVFISLLGWLAVPLAYRLLPNLHGRGFAFARPIGLLMWGFVFFLLASLQVLQNDTGGVLLALIPLLALSIWIYRKQYNEINTWIKESRSLILVVEILFLAAFAFLALMRSADPGLIGTEKPMEMAFINAILRSPNFPPNDPWLAGYAISYYYFGYILVAMLIRMTGVDPAAAFNLAISVWYAMTAVGAYGVVQALVTGYKERRARRTGEERSSSAMGLPGPGRTSLVWPLLAPVFLLVSGNLQGFLELLFARGVFWKQVDGLWTSGFWRWLNIQEMCQAPYPPFSWLPDRPGIWWWRASRILHDFDVSHYMQAAAGNVCVVGREIIDEIPAFTFFLADLHPHVLAMPFALLAVAIALNLYLQPRGVLVGGTSLWQGFKGWFYTEPVKFKSLEAVRWLRQTDFWFMAIALGGLAFLNTWDFPIYVALVACAYTLARYEKVGWSGRRIGEFLEMAVLLGVCGILLYLPFYVGFASQAGGIFPSVIFFTRGAHFWVYFAVILLPICAWLAALYARRGGSFKRFMTGLRFAAAVIFGLWLLSFIAGWLFSNLSAWGNLIALNAGKMTGLADRLIGLGSQFQDLQGDQNAGSLLAFALVKRLQAPGAWISLLVVLAAVWGMLGANRCPAESDPPAETDAPIEAVETGSSNSFALLLALVGLGLVIVPEFFYLRDQFGWRMNTIFKFYFQAWILWSLVAAYGSIMLWKWLKGAWKALFAAFWLILLLMSLVYPFYLVQDRLGNLSQKELDLNGIAYIEQSAPEEASAISYLRSAPFGYMVEAVGGSYTDFERISTHTGLPTVLGWPGHEGQWRGGGKEMGSREVDVRRLYESSNWNEAEQILKEYNIRYIYISNRERSVYRVNELKFQQFLQPVFNQGSVVIYEAP